MELNRKLRFDPIRIAMIAVVTQLMFLMACSNSDDDDDEPQVSTEIDCNVDFGDPASSNYILPFSPGKEYPLSQTYCPPNPAWGHHNWFAYDFDMNIGDTIIAARAGTVIFVDEQWVDGNRTPGEENFIFIEHSDGTVASYVHLTKDGVLRRVNERVSQGQPIGLSGDTGNSAGPHLHFAVFGNRFNFDRQSTRPVNFRNAEGPLDDNRGLVHQGKYLALPF